MIRRTDYTKLSIAAFGLFVLLVLNAEQPIGAQYFNTFLLIIVAVAALGLFTQGNNFRHSRFSFQEVDARLRNEMHVTEEIEVINGVKHHRRTREIIEVAESKGNQALPTVEAVANPALPDSRNQEIQVTTTQYKELTNG